jgi:uncharacterized protein (UPF0332 family)
MTDFDDSLEKGFLKRINPDSRAAEQELRLAEYDLLRSKSTLSNEDDKWAAVQAYYAMFHAARALLFAVGLKERSHSAVQAALEELSKNGIIESISKVNFAAAREAREDSDYRGKFSKATAESTVENADDFLQDIRSAMNKLKSNGEKKVK